MAKYKLYLNNKFTGKYLNCEFQKGEATTDNKMIVNYFKRHNLKFEEVKPEIKKEVKEVEEKEIDFKKISKSINKITKK